MSFSRYEVYTSVQSIYCYPDTDILRNKLNIRDQETLKTVEEEISAVKLFDLYQTPIRGRFSKSHLRRIHKYLFGDLYSFAGSFRKESISKGTTQFFPPQLIEREMDRVFETIHNGKFLTEKSKSKQIDNLSFTMAELNIIHPFREGNGRTIREFVRCMALHYGLELNWEFVEKKEVLEASILSVDDPFAFTALIKHCISNQI